MKRVSFNLTELVAMLIALAIIAALIAGCGGSGGSKSIFDDPTGVSSPHGIVPEGSKAYSPDGKFYAMEQSPTGYGKISIYNRQTNELRKVIQVQTGSPNNLKAMAWSRDSQYLAFMYHGSHEPYREYYGINLYKVETGLFERHITDNQYHYMVFSRDNTLILASDYANVTQGSYPSGLPATADR